MSISTFFESVSGLQQQSRELRREKLEAVSAAREKLGIEDELLFKTLPIKIKNTS
jgi:hypothetical protein